MTTTISILGFLLGIFIYRTIKLSSEMKYYKTLTKNYEKETSVMSVELKGIMSLNKMCIEKWEKAVLENANLNKSNYQLIQVVQEHQKKST